MLLKLALCGFGNVGQALARIILEKGEEYRLRYGLDFQVQMVIDSGGTAYSPDGLPLDELLELKREGIGVAAHPRFGRPGFLGAEVLEEVPFDVLVELSPTNIRHGEPGLGNIRKAISLGKHVVTANKGPLVLAWRELRSSTEAAGVGLKFGGATAAALPTTNVGHYDLAGCLITGLEGILNGTTNFILTRMSQHGWGYDRALSEAQKLGIAERDPSLDVEGWDTAVKLLILANAVMGADLTLDQVDRKGITALTPSDFAEAAARGRIIKLVGSARPSGILGERRGVAIRVAPVALPSDHPLARVDGTEKALTFETDLMGRLTVMGGGSGPTPAAASVVRDLINLAREVRYV